MQLTIDNLDGLGPIDYSASIDISAPFEIVRALNVPSLLKGTLCLAGTTLAVPSRRSRVVVTGSNSAAPVLFTGCLATEPAPVYAGVASQGPVYRLALNAVSDEWLLDKQSSGTPAGLGLGTAGGPLVAAFAARVSPSALNTSALSSGRSVGVFAPVKGAPWSAHVGAIADATYSAYTALSGSVALTPLTSVQHALSDGDGSLSIAALKTASVRELANDVTVTGTDAPSAYWTELFTGDGSTAIFNLLGEPAAPNAGRSVLISDPFNQSVIDPQTWSLADPGSHLALSGSGLAFSGGNGLDGQTTLSAWDPLELGGTIVLELGSVALAAGSAGVIGGLYSGSSILANCFAGFDIRQSGGQTLATPLVNGVEAGTSLTILPGHLYTLRIHLHSPELLRVNQTFYAMTETSGALAVNQFGGGTSASPMSLVFEARDLGASSNTPVTILYDSASAGAVPSSPAQATVVAVNSLALVGSIGSIHVATTGSCWITSTPTTGSAFTRLAGAAAEGAAQGLDCTVTSSVIGKLTFFPGRVPAAGETIAVSYRGRQRAVARLADPASIAAETSGGGVGTARWLGHVVRPPARSAEDCENAAAAILSFSANRSAAISGSYVAVNPPATDIWPGDVLVLTTEQGALNVIARHVVLSTQGASPEALLFRIAFANDWAEGLGIKLSETIPADALLPATALDLVSGSAGAHTLPNLQQMTFSAPAAGFMAVDAGLAPPVGGGFEVRRRDGGFGVGAGSSSSGDLVLRSPVRGFSIPVASAPETFFIRMYDASSPPLYSRLSTAIVCHLAGS